MKTKIDYIRSLDTLYDDSIAYNTKLNKFFIVEKSGYQYDVEEHDDLHDLKTKIHSFKMYIAKKLKRVK